MKGHNPDLMNGNVVASISPYASAKEGDGHYYWMYHHLQRMQNPAGPALTMSLETAIAPHLLSSLSTNRPLPRLHVGAKQSRQQDQDTISDWILNQQACGITHVQCYDGTLYDLFVVSAVAHNNPGVVFVFNFHWATDWLEVAHSSKPHRRLVRQRVSRILSEAPPNLKWSAESERLAHELATHWNISISEYPVFTMQDSATSRKWEDRESDVLFIPQRRDELLFSIPLASRLRTTGRRVSLGISKKLASTQASGRADTDLGAVFDQIYILPLGESDYRQMIESHRITVLPYLKPYFAWGSSGKFNESIALGTFPMVPDQTAIAFQSKGRPADHQFPQTSPEQTTALIQARLKIGFPCDLRPVTFEDFASWITGFQTEHSELSRQFRQSNLFGIRVLEHWEDLWGYSRDVQNRLFNPIYRFVKHSQLKQRNRQNPS